MDPFAKALQANSKSRSKKSVSPLSPELEKNMRSQNISKGADLNPFSQALARAGGKSFDGLNSDDFSQADLEQQQKDLEKKQKKEALRQKLHKEINPVDLHDLYSAESERTRKGLEKTRKMLEVEILKLRSDVKGLATEITLFQEVVDQGREGIGLKAYFEKIREFLKILRKKVHSARTWLHTQNAKSKKKKRGKGKTGIEISGKQHEQTKAVFDQMHHEQSSTYSGN
jgi:hypothetical protein